MITASLGAMPEEEDGQESQSQPVALKGQARKQSLIQAFFQRWKAGHEHPEVGARAWEAVAHMLGGCYSIYT